MNYFEQYKNFPIVYLSEEEFVPFYMQSGETIEKAQFTIKIMKMLNSFIILDGKKVKIKNEQN